MNRIRDIKDNPIYHAIAAIIVIVSGTGVITVKMARPYPFTSLDFERERIKIEQRIDKEINKSKRECDQLIQNVEDHLVELLEQKQRRLEADLKFWVSSGYLPSSTMIPPPEVNLLLDRHQEHIIRMQDRQDRISERILNCCGSNNRTNGAGSIEDIINNEEF